MTPAAALDLLIRAQSATFAAGDSAQHSRAEQSRAEHVEMCTQEQYVTLGRGWTMHHLDTAQAHGVG